MMKDLLLDLLIDVYSLPAVDKLEDEPCHL